MPSRRQVLLDLRNVQGLSITGPATGTPPTMLRRARGLHETCAQELRPHPNNTLLYNRAGIHSITRFNDIHYFAAGTTLYRAGIALYTNTNTNRLTLTRMPPGNTQPDQLFWCGGGVARKVDETTTEITTVSVYAGGAGYVIGDTLALTTPTGGTAATVTVTAEAAGVITAVTLTTKGLRYTIGIKATTPLTGTGAGATIEVLTTTLITLLWGLTPPADGFTVSNATQLTKTIELFEAFGDWAITGTGVIAANEATIKQEGANSLKITIPASTLATLTKALVLDLSQFATAGDSSIEDYIEIWFRVDGVSAGFDYFTLRFDVGGGTFAADYYQFKFLPTSITQNRMVLTGIGADPSIAASELTFVGDSQGGSESGEGTSDSASAADSGAAGDGTAMMSSATWSRLRMPKSLFLRAGNSAASWANVTAIQLMIQTNSLSAITVYIDYARMRGGAGLLGDYQSLVTFDNTATGARSISNPTPVITLQNDRQRLTYASLPRSTDPQVNARTLWRTLGNGAAFFREKIIPDNTATTYSSRVADFIGLWTNAQSDVLYLPELPTDNTQPEGTHLDFIYDQATVFWLSSASAKKGRVYFSPAGRPEAQSGFIQVTNDDMPLFRLIVWNRARYLIGEGGWWRIDGTGPYTTFKFQGIPGVLAAQARTITPTPFGVAWQAKDGLRLFNGSQAPLLHYDRLGPLFRKESAEQLTSFQGIVAAFARDQYFISDGTQTLAINLATGFIRDLGLGCSALYYEEDTRSLLAALSDGLYILEDETAGASSTAFTIRTADYLFPDNTVGWVDQVFVDGKLAAAATLYLDTIALALTALAPSGRQLLERQVGYPARTISLELSGSAPSTSSLYGVECAVRDCTLELLTAQGALSLRGRSSNLTQSILFQVLEEQRQTVPFDNILLAYLLTVDVACNGASFTPTLTFEEGTLILNAITGTTRALKQIQLARLGHLLSITLTGNFRTPITLYRAELELRPVLLSVLINGQRLPLQARMRTSGTGLAFELPDDMFLGAAPTQTMLIRRLTLDADTNNQLLTPSIITDHGTTILPPMQSPTRAYREWPLGLPGRPRRVVLDCNVTRINALYAAELHLYVPSNGQRSPV